MPKTVPRAVGIKGSKYASVLTYNDQHDVFVTFGYNVSKTENATCMEQSSIVTKS